jgi:hypothetical protein
MNKSILIAGAALVVIAAAYILGQSYKYKFKQAETISITGVADTNFVSDLSVWSGNFSRTSFNMQEAFDALKKDEALVMSYIEKQGLGKSEMKTSSINTEKLFSYTYDEQGNQKGSVFNGYKLSESITIESTDLNKVDRISRDITQLIQQGVELSSSSPNYYYSKLSTLKIGLLAKASEDAYERAKTIAKNSGVSVGNLRKASMGVFQITGQNENEDYSYGGAFNTTSINKTATVTVKSEYEIR